MTNSFASFFVHHMRLRDVYGAFLVKSFGIRNIGQREGFRKMTYIPLRWQSGKTKYFIYLEKGDLLVPETASQWEQIKGVKNCVFSII